MEQQTRPETSLPAQDQDCPDLGNCSPLEGDAYTFTIMFVYLILFWFIIVMF